MRYLEKNSQELELLFRELLIGVTSFFRDPEVWNQFARHILPTLIESNHSKKNLRAWVPACSTGEEAYSLAMIFKETIGQMSPSMNFKLQIFATDLNKDAIEKARRRLFSAKAVSELSPARLQRFFIKQEKSYLISSEIREMVIFAPHNVTVDPPFTKLDVLICRNLLIYLSSAVQKRIIPLFQYSLNPNGVLILGTSESIGNFTTLFTTYDSTSRIYLRTLIEPDLKQINLPAKFSAGIETRSAANSKFKHSLESFADTLILQQYAPPAVMINPHGDILYVSGHTRKYLEPAAGRANWNIFSMAHEAIRYEIAAALKQALAQPGETALRQSQFEKRDHMSFTEIRAKQLQQPTALKGLIIIITFSDVTPMRSVKFIKAAGQTSASNQIDELNQIKSQALANEESVQVLKEEYHAANEELQSTNEELQSTNEELTTSEEEMQSVNEELQSVNSERQTKLDELALTINDMKNLLDSTDIAIIFLDKQLKIRRFTPQTTQIIKLIESDRLRPISDLAFSLNYPELLECVNTVMRTRDMKEKEISTSNGHWYNLRIIPYCTLSQQVDGVVLTFSDITKAKRLEAELRKYSAKLQEDLSLNSASN